MQSSQRGEQPGLRRRGPSSAKTARTRASIVAAALDTFLARGYEGTRMADVAARAGLAKGTLYLHFADKEALFEGVLREVVATPFSAIGVALPGPEESVRDFLSRVVLPLMRNMERSRRADVIRLLVAETARFPALGAIYRRLVVDPVSAFIRALGERAVARGELTSDALVRFPLLLVAPGLVATLWNGLIGRDAPLDTGAVFEAWLDLVFPP